MMAQFTLNTNDILACIELASDGLAVHQHNPEMLDTIHKVMYALAQASQSPHISCCLKGTLEHEYNIHLQASNKNKN